MPEVTDASALHLLTGDARAFCEKSWASRVHRHHTSPDPFTGLLSLADVDHLLTQTAIRAPAVRLARDGSVIPESQYTRGATMAGKAVTGLVDPRKLLDLFEGGASVVLQGLQRYWPPLADFCQRLESELGHPVQANAYLTPPGSQGFGVHADTHDVFVFQTHGRKLWEIHEDGERSDVLIEPGLVLYLPTGTRHAARAQDATSLHVTLGINQLTWRDILRPALDGALRALPGIDEHLPAAYGAEAGVLASGIRQRLDALVDAVAALDPRVLEEDQIRRFGSGRPTRVPGGLLDRLELDALSQHTPLVRRRPLHVRANGDRLELLLGDRILLVPARIRAAAEYVRDHGRFTAADLPLDPQSQLVLARRLVREGLLRVATTAGDRG